MKKYPKKYWVTQAKIDKLYKDMCLDLLLDEIPFIYFVQVEYLYK